VTRQRLQTEINKTESKDSVNERSDSDQAFSDKVEEEYLDNHEISMNMADHRKFDDWILFCPKLFGAKLKSFDIYEKACLINPTIEGLSFEVNDLASKLLFVADYKRSEVLKLIPVILYIKQNGNFFNTSFEYKRIMRHKDSCLARP
jgi:hypothetical protein